MNRAGKASFVVALVTVLCIACATPDPNPWIGNAELRNQIGRGGPDLNNDHQLIELELPVFVQSDNTAIADLRLESKVGSVYTDAPTAYAECIDLVYPRGGLKSSQKLRMAKIKGRIKVLGALVGESGAIVTSLKTNGAEFRPQCNYTAERYAFIEVVKIEFVSSIQ